MTDATEAPAPSSLAEPVLADAAETDPAQTDPALSDLAGTDPAQMDAAVAAFRRQLEGQVSLPASAVQDCLLDLWGSLPEGDSRTEVERWLTETLERTLYSATDVASRLASVLPAAD